MKAICVIPARGGSKRIPRKNIKEFFGKPIISYSIQTALESGLFNDVIVSTDNFEIASVARKYGAQVPFMRSPEYASDNSTTAEVLQHVLDWYEGKGVSWDVICCLYPTAPFCSVKSLSIGYEMLLKPNVPAVLPVAEYAYPIMRSLKINIDGCVEMNCPEYELTRSQDLPGAYHDAGQFYWLRVDLFKKNPRLMPKGTKPMILSRINVVDIDTPEDWEVAESLYGALRK